MQQHTTLWQLDGWAKAVVHTACVHYDCYTRQQKVANKGARTAPCCDLDYQRCHLEVCWNRPGALVSDGRALSGLQHSSDLLPWNNVTCVRSPVCARACMQTPTTGPRRDEMALVCPDRHGTLLQK